MIPWCLAAARGSSPLARGLQLGSARARGAVGIIPARAGFTAWPAEPRRVRSDHPRSRGVYIPLTHPHRASTGSSPLARGLPSPPAGPARAHGIIPARAGFTLAPLGRRSRARDHPRSRGVYSPFCTDTNLHPGSSPLARGLHFPYSLPTFTRDHPRSRGVYIALAASSVSPGGSSPLARGLLRRDLALFRGRRIIPARAGFTTPWS